MSNMTNTDNVKEQYADERNLLARIKLHAKYSTNKYGFSNWLFDYHYKFTDSCKILELGCGIGGQWEGRIEHLPSNSTLILSDLSIGMINSIWNKYAQYPNVLAARIDIQDIPFPASSFDFVIANHMLYHVPDLQKAISEVCRILKPEGVFYAATNGTGGMRPFLHNALKEFNSNINSFVSDQSFTLQNGLDILHKYFEDVVRVDYEDSFEITETQDLVDWITSTISIASFCANDLIGLYDYFEKHHKRDGVIIIPKEAGLFIAHK